MSETLSVADVLRKALEAFGPNGEFWAKGMDSFDAPKCCVTLSFSRIEPELPPFDPIADKACLLLAEVSGISHASGALEDWNDAPERTFAEVKALFEKAIAKAGTQ